MNPQASPPPGSTRKTGRFMLIAAWILGMLVLTQLFGKWETTQYNPNQAPLSQKTQEGRIEVVLQRNRQGHYLVRGKINDRPQTFLLDTGATDIVIPGDIARDLRLRALGRDYAMTANGMIEVERTLLDSVSIGAIILYNVPASINPAMSADSAILLGMSALRQLDFTQRDGVLTLSQ